MIQSRPMKASNRNKFLALMSFHLLWGFALWFSISKLGLGISTDSVPIMFGGLNLFEAGRLVSYDGGPLLAWPPLYPALLGLLHLATGLSPFAAAHLLQAVSFAGLSVSLSLLFLRIFPGNFVLALAANVLADVGVVVVEGFDLLGSDYVHLFLVVLYLYLTARYIADRSPRIFVALAVVGMLAMLDRYLGVAAIATGAASVVWLAGGNWPQKLARGFFLSLSALPAGIWLFMTAPLLGRRAPISFAENFQWFSRSLLEWFLPDSVTKAHLTLWITLLWIVMLGSVALLFVRRRIGMTPFARPVLLFGLAYILALFGSASITYYNKLGGRFLLPLYIPFVTLVVLCAHIILETAKERSSTLGRLAAIGAYGALVVTAALELRVSFPVILASHAGSSVGDNSFNTAEWRANTAIAFWLTNPPRGRYLLFSNYPDAVAFYTQHSVASSPRQFSGPYGTVEYPVEGYAGELFSPGQKTYLIWIEPNAYDYFYSPEDLSPVADVRVLFSGSDGGVYRLSPKAGD